MKQTKHWLATIATLLCSFSASAHDFEAGGIYYNITSSTDLTVAVTYRGDYYYEYSNEYSGAVTIPETVTYNNNTYSVTSIGNSAFSGCSSLTSITLPESVTSIGNSAFSGCSSLTSIILPERVTSIRNYAFSGCSSLTAITLPEGVTSIGEYAFYYCSSLTSIILPEGVTSIGEYAFSDCSSLTSIILPEGVTSIGYYAFYECSSLYKVINCSNLSLSNGSSNYGYVAYYAKVVYQGGECTTVDNFQFYASNGIHSLVNYIGDDTEIVLPDSYNGENYKIGDYAFYYCSRLTSITLPEGVTSIGYYAFYECSSLYKVINCSNLSLSKGFSSNGYVAYHAKVVYQGGECTTVDNFQFYASNSSHSLVNYIGNDTEIVLPDSYNGENYKIGDYAFYNCSRLTSITIPESVTSIGNYTFCNCSRLTSITIPESVTSIGNYTFCNCSRLTSITIPESVTSIGNYTFCNCSRLTSITIPEGVTSVGNCAFDNCTALKKVIIEDGSSTLSLGYNSSSQGLFYDCPLEEVYLGRNLSYNSGSSYGYSPFYNKDALTNVTIGNEVTQISEYAFYGCDNIHSLTIPSGVLSIGSNAFNTPEKVIWLTNTPPTGYTNVKGSINYAANNQHSSLSNLKVYPYLSSMFEVDGVKYVPVSPSERTCHAIDCAYDSTATIINVGETASFKGVAMKVTEVMPYTFCENNYIEKVFIAHSGNIGDCAFYNCSSLNAITLGDSIGSLGSRAFYQCTNLLEIVVPNSVKVVGEYCFSGCSTMTNVELGNSVATINNYAFQNCSSLSEICIPQSTTTIGNYAFSGCSQLADVIIEDRTTALNLGSNGSSALFADCSLDSVYIGGKITYNTTSSKGYSPFYRNTSLRTVVITDREEQIYDNEFYGCTNLQNVTIGNGVKSIGNYAFSGCSSLEGFSFGSNMESIGSEAFSDCTNLTSITSHAAVPPTCGTQALDDINKWNCVLGVPLGNAEAYYAAEQWKDFFFIDAVVEVDHYVLTYVVDGEVVHTEVLKHKDAVTMLAEPTKVGYEFSGWDKTITTMPAEDVIISGTFTRLPIENLVILDTETDFAVDEDMECETVTYIRDFKDTQWQALYVPFEIPVTEEFLADFEVADLNNVHQYDHDDNGVIDETVIEAFKMTSGTLEANYPYLIRAKEAGEKSSTVTDAVLYATEENSIDCSSVRDKFTFTGTYSSLSSAELPQGEGYYTLIEGEWKPVTEAVALGAFRFYLKVDSRSGALAAEARSIRMRIIGENGYDDDTSIDNSEFIIKNSELIYDLQGRRVENPTKGIYIVNGKRVVIK